LLLAVSILLSRLILCWEWLYWFLRVYFIEILLFLIGLKPRKDRVFGGWPLLGCSCGGFRADMLGCFGDMVCSPTIFFKSLSFD
jgi:hypothetical protein